MSNRKMGKVRKQWGRKGIAALLLAVQMVAMPVYGSGAASQYYEVKAEKKQIAKVQSIVSQLNQTYQPTSFNAYSYSASVSPVSQFQTEDGKYGEAYSGETEVMINIYSQELKIERTIEIKHEFQLVGGVTCDRQGNLYIVYGQENPENDQAKDVLIIRKYDRNGIQLNEVTYRANETRPYSGEEWGTKNPFHAGNLSTAFQGSILAINYARQMYSGHQSNHVVYIDTNTMQKLYIAPSYVSHSFDQRILATSDGEFLTLNHGDAYWRGFVVSKIGSYVTNTFDVDTYTMFHFREGANRDHGYNETYAQLGDVVELEDSYAVVAASEKTLSYDTAPTNREYCGHSEARNLFVQFLKKGYQNYSGADRYQVPGEERIATGEQPKNALTKLYLEEGAKDDGVVWLTNYQEPYFVANPKVVKLNQEEMAILYEKREYGDGYSLIQDSYYMIVDHTGKIVKGPISMGGVELPADEEVVYLNGEIYWTTTKRPQNEEAPKLQTNKLILNEMVDVKPIKEVKVEHPKRLYGSDDRAIISVMDGNEQLVEGVDYDIIRDDDSDYKKVYQLTGLGRYSGSRRVEIDIAPSDIKLKKLESKQKGQIQLIFSEEEDGVIQVWYADNPEFKNAKKYTLYWYDDDVIDQLDSKKTYYVKVRKYYETESGKRNYGRFSKVKKIKVK